MNQRGHYAWPVRGTLTEGSATTTQPVCQVCGRRIFYSASQNYGSKWFHADTLKVRCQQAADQDQKEN